MQERTDISDDFPDVVETLRARLFEVLTDAYDPDDHPELMAADSCPDNFNMEVTVGESIKDLYVLSHFISLLLSMLVRE